MPSENTKAEDLVKGPRQDSYGHPAIDFNKSGKILSALGYRFVDDAGVARDVNLLDIPIIMNVIKLSRQSHKHNDDNILDIKGYMVCHDLVREYIKERPDDFPGIKL